MGLANNRIRVLSTSVANQIAAGEVIERPASVVKELLENALDAGASAIVIDIGFGGLNQVKISDNGKGIYADDLSLAIAAHATSKINQLSDLYAIDSMGFRGEALASIASVSRLSIDSKPAEQPHAMGLRFDGETLKLLPCARSVGTTIDVRDIFFNAPVRKNFLKTERSEYLAIESVVKRFALSAPEVAITLSHNDKQTLMLPAALCEQTKLLRIQKLLGKTFVDHAIYLDVERAGMRLQGWVSGPGYQRSQHDKQWVYLNRRMVKDKLINHALKQAYEGQLHPGRYPACVLYLTMAADQVDVNVHPTKHEVRFQQPRLVHDLITSQLLNALAVNHEATSPFLGEEKIALKVDAGASMRSYPQETRTHWDVREPMPTSTGSWLVLNAYYAIIHWHNEPWLLNIQALQQERWKVLLQQAMFPLASRPLLVPVSSSFDKANHALIESMLPVLAQVGMQCDFMSESRLMVRTIPQLLPSLDIQAFLLILDKERLSLDECISTLVACQTLDARQLCHDEKTEIMAYLDRTPNALNTVGLRMDLETCRGLLHD